LCEFDSLGPRMMRFIPLCFVLSTSLLLSACAVSSWSQQPGRQLTTAFWYWQGSSVDPTWSSQPVDAVFVQVGNIRSDRPGGGTERWFAYGDLPKDLPPARDYWLVYRFDGTGVPDVQVAPIIGEEISQLQATAQDRNLHVIGVQLDIDSPTGSLVQYARFLHEVRTKLPSGLRISITALLDWFRSGTSVDGVINEVDEFVPQFYDLSDPTGYGRKAAITAQVDAVRWGPVFNRFGKPFRIGISTFGRARAVPVAANSGTAKYARISLFGDVGLMDIATNSAFEIETSRDPANELVLTFRAKHETRIDYNRFGPGDAIQFILATPESVRSAVDNVRRMHGNLIGVAFFRWPATEDTLAMQPEEVLAAAGNTPQHPKPARVEVVNGHCAAVQCGDIYLMGADPFFPKETHYEIRSSANFEYFLPEHNMPVRILSPSQLDLSLPAYCGRGRLYLGRAITATRSEFTVERQ